MLIIDSVHISNTYKGNRKINEVKVTSFPDHCQLGKMYMKCEMAQEQDKGVISKNIHFDKVHLI